MENYQPYTYLIKFKPTGQLYYGVSFGNNRYKIAHPSELWDTYYTSSQTIKQLLIEYGKDAFEYQVRKIFKTKERALKCEQRVLQHFNAKSNPMWFNKSNGGRDFFINEETRLKMSQAKKGKPSHKKGKSITEEQKVKIASTRLAHNIKHSDETRAKMSSKKQGSNNHMFGRQHSSESKLKMSIAATGRISSIKGIPKSDEQKAKQSATMKAKRLAKLT